MPDTDTQNTAAWTTYGAHQLARGIELPELEGWAWDIPDAGPGIEVLGNVTGLRVLDLGSGLGRHAARLAALGAQVTAVDSSPHPARTRHRPLPGHRRSAPWDPACWFCTGTRMANQQIG
ncbi:class I SAM-dependent methyltransferase [Streptomyces koyangensis]|uniref:class I SAM-dependent methyltransferase n=1 Tax=Streptomyces koyangensis TaxID=188770 RepID=UPI0036638E19